MSELDGRCEVVMARYMHPGMRYDKIGMDVEPINPKMNSMLGTSRAMISAKTSRKMDKMCLSHGISVSTAFRLRLPPVKPTAARC